MTPKPSSMTRLGPCTTVLPSRPVLEDAYRWVNHILFAEHIGLGFNALATLTWKHARGFDKTDPGALSAFHNHIMRGCRDFFRERRSPFDFSWLREREVNVGLHEHIVLRLPQKDFDFECELLRSYLEQRGNFAGNHGVTIRGHHFHGPHRPGFNTRREISRILVYGLKTIDQCMTVGHGRNRQLLRDVLGLDELEALLGFKELKRGCPLAGRHVGGSHSFGPAARKEHGWKEIASLEALRDALWCGYSPLNETRLPPAPNVRAAGVALEDRQSRPAAFEPAYVEYGRTQA